MKLRCSGQEGKWTPIYVGRLLYLCVRRFNKQFQENCSFHEFHRSGFPGFTAQKRPSSSLTTAVHHTCRFDSSLQSRRCQRSSALIFIVQFNSLSVVCTNNPVWRSKHNTSWWKRSRPVSLSKAAEILNHPVSHQRSYTLHGAHRSSVELCGSQCLSIEEVAHSWELLRPAFHQSPCDFIPLLQPSIMAIPFVKTQFSDMLFQNFRPKLFSEFHLQFKVNGQWKSFFFMFSGFEELLEKRSMFSFRKYFSLLANKF